MLACVKEEFGLQRQTDDNEKETQKMCLDDKIVSSSIPLKDVNNSLSFTKHPLLLRTGLKVQDWKGKEA